MEQFVVRVPALFSLIDSYSPLYLVLQDVVRGESKLRDDFVHLAANLGLRFIRYAYPLLRGKNKAPLQVAYTTQTKQVDGWKK